MAAWQSVWEPISCSIAVSTSHRHSDRRQPQPFTQQRALRLRKQVAPLQRQLLRLVHDDLALAERLFALATIRYAGNSPNWYVEKVIYDLERDRGKF